MRFPECLTEPYDLVNDPCELYNPRIVAPSSPATQALLARLTARIDEFLSQ